MNAPRRAPGVEFGGGEFRTVVDANLLGQRAAPAGLVDQPDDPFRGMSRSAGKPDGLPLCGVPRGLNSATRTAGVCAVRVG